MPCMYAKIWLSYREQNIHFLCRWNGLHALWSWQDPPQTPSDSLRSLLVVKSPRGSAPLLPTQCGWASTFDLLFWGSLLPFFLFLLSSPLLLPLPLLVFPSLAYSAHRATQQWWWSDPVLMKRCVRWGYRLCITLAQQGQHKTQMAELSCRSHKSLACLYWLQMAIPVLHSTHSLHQWPSHSALLPIIPCPWDRSELTLGLLKPDISSVGPLYRLKQHEKKHKKVWRKNRHIPKILIQVRKHTHT